MSIYLRNFIRFVMLVLIQGLLLNTLSQRWWPSPGVLPPFIPFIYPLFILLLPLATPVWFMLISGFVLGVSIDAFMDTGGMHAAACVLMAFFRMSVLAALLPRKLRDYGNVTPSVKMMGWTPFLTYAAILLLMHHLVYFIMEIWNIHSIVYMLTKTLLTLITSILFVVIYALLFSHSISKSD